MATKKNKEVRKQYSVRQEPSVIEAIKELYGSFTEFVDEMVQANPVLLDRASEIKKRKVSPMKVFCTDCEKSYSVKNGDYKEDCPFCTPRRDESKESE